MPVKPISPAEATTKRQTSIPDAVIEAFNELITENLSGSSATVLQKHVVARIRQKLGDEACIGMFDKGWLDVEPIFEKVGWAVKYDKPCYYGGDNYEAYFEFRKKRAR